MTVAKTGAGDAGTNTEDPSKAAAGTTGSGKDQGAAGDAGAGAGAESNKFESDKWIETLDKDSQDYVKKLRSEAAYRRKSYDEADKKAKELEAELNSYKQKETEAAEAKMREDGKHKELLEKREQELSGLKDNLRRQEVRIQAVKAGIIDEDVANLIPMDKVSFDSAGKIVGAEEAVNAYKSEKANLFKDLTAAAAGSAGNSTQSTATSTKRVDPPASSSGRVDLYELSKTDPKAYKQRMEEFTKGR